MRDYSYFWQRVADWVPVRKRIRQLERELNTLEEDYEDLKLRLDQLERTADRLRLEIKEHPCQDRKNST